MGLDAGVAGKNTQSPPTVVSLFTGAGGLDLGLRDLDLLACVEISPIFCATLEQNRDAGLLGSSQTKIVQADLSRLDPYDLMDQLGLQRGELDILVGGPPCQSFSTAGRRRTVSDPRGTLLWSFLRFVEVLRPKVFVMENVRGLLSAALRHRAIADRPNTGGAALSAEELPGSVIQAWAEDLMKINNAEYRADCFEVNAVNYGAPQLRERVIIIGNRLGQTLDFPAPTHGRIDANTGMPEDGLLPFSTLGTALDGYVDPAPVLVDFSPRKKRFLSMVPPGGNWRSLPEQVARESMGAAYHAKGGRSGWWRRLSWDLPCPTIVTLPNHASTSMCHPDEVRVLTVGESAVVQGFPRQWRFAGTAQEQMTQVGNAVPVRLGEVVLGVVSQCLAGGSVDAPMDQSPFRRVYLNSHVRTRQWWRAGKAFVWDGMEGTAHYGTSRKIP